MRKFLSGHATDLITGGEVRKFEKIRHTCYTRLVSVLSPPRIFYGRRRDFLNAKELVTSVFPLKSNSGRPCDAVRHSEEFLKRLTYEIISSAVEGSETSVIILRKSYGQHFELRIAFSGIIFDSTIHLIVWFAPSKDIKSHFGLRNSQHRSFSMPH